ANEDEFDQLENDVYDIRWYRRDGWDALWRSRQEVADAELAELLREVFGNPFRPPRRASSPPTLSGWPRPATPRSPRSAPTTSSWPTPWTTWGNTLRRPIVASPCTSRGVTSWIGS